MLTHTVRASCIFSLSKKAVFGGEIASALKVPQVLILQSQRNVLLWPCVALTRLIVIRHRLADKTSRAGGKMLLDGPGYLYQGLGTHLPMREKPLAVWRE